VWSDITATSAHFERSYSDDGGKTWEVSWITDQTRISDSRTSLDERESCRRRILPSSRDRRKQRPYWGQCLMRTIIRPAAANSQDHTAYRVAHLRHYVFFIVKGKQNGHQGKRKNCFVMLLAGSRWTRIPRPSHSRSDEPRAASFVFCRRPHPRTGAVQRHPMASRLSGFLLLIKT
jgi:hypothetical protein